MPKASAAPGEPCGWGIRLFFQGRTVAQIAADDADPVALGERKDCDLVLPGVGEHALLTDGATLVVPAGLVGEVHVGERTQPAEGRVTLSPGDRASLRVVAHPDITLEVQRVTREHLPWSARFHARDLARQLVTGAALVAMVALLWRIEKVENVLKLRGEPTAEDDSPLMRVIYAPTAEPIEVIRARELYAAHLPPPPPPPAPAPVEPGLDLATSGPMAIPLAQGGVLAAEPVTPDLAEEAPVEAPRPGKKSRRSKRRPDAFDGAELEMVAVLSHETSVLSALVAEDDSAYGGLLGLRGEGGGGFGEGVAVGIGEVHGVAGGVVDVIEGGVEGGVPGGVVGVEGGVVGGVEGGVVNGVAGGVVLHGSMPEAPGPEGHVPPNMPPREVLTVGPNSHASGGATATRGERDGLAAAVAQASCADPAVVRKQQIDVVFAVDVSTTMNFMLGKIGREIAAVDATVRAHNLDARYGLVVFVDDVMVTNGGQAFADLAALQQELAKWQQFTAGNREIVAGEANLDWPENTLDALHAAATQFAWRDRATTLRAVVHATDDDFGEAPAMQSGQRVQHGYRDTVAALRAAEVRVFSFAAKVGGQCECLDVRAGLFAPYRGQQAIPAATGGAVFDIDEVASGALGFGAAVSGALQSAVCTHYPLAPFPAK
ncbi:VWA domain-containing protein [Nannocystis sp. ILAH1]|uniref:vWA domain-containing protein n=1 Tax=Nannocystis sp. ILAH1 TaxID=2996789 RepID=UPI00226E1BC0|nr:vWA domain-containing protein [Nannocystis sp. ILAH1]MCY0986269.1 VWA domain-containing protein [Nannocystis sp. ILAH1]